MLMEFEQFQQFGTLLLKDAFVLSYSGYVTEDILEAVGATLRQRLGDHINSPQQINNVFSIFVELMQNVIRYGTDGPQPVGILGDRESFGLIMVAQNGTSMDILSGNYVTKAAAKALVKRVDLLKDKTPEELHKVYRLRLNQPPDINSKGASIGLIEIARRSSIPLECNAHNTADGLCFFMVKASVQRFP